MSKTFKDYGGSANEKIGNQHKKAYNDNDTPQTFFFPFNADDRDISCWN